MRLYLLLFCLLSILLCTVSAKAQEIPSYKPALYIHEGDTLPYRILFPSQFDPSQTYPLILILHGAGERGNDNEAQLIHGSRLFLQENIRKNHPAIVVFPQCPSSSYWSNVEVNRNTQPMQFEFQTEGEPTQAMKLLQGLVHSLIALPYVNKKQLYVGGLSMGGMGTLELLRREPGLFAAAFAICGGDNPENSKKYKNTPLWLFHGSKDDVVPVKYSVELSERLEQEGAKNIRLTIYPEATHNSWAKAFADPLLLQWLLSKQKK